MKFLDDHYPKYLKKDDIELLLRFTYDVRNIVFLKEKKGMACCDSWGHKESDTTEWLNWTDLTWRQEGLGGKGVIHSFTLAKTRSHAPLKISRWGWKQNYLGSLILCPLGTLSLNKTKNDGGMAVAWTNIFCQSICSHSSVPRSLRYKTPSSQKCTLIIPKMCPPERSQ